MLSIEVFDGKYRITSDLHNVIVQRRHIVDPTKSPTWSKREEEGASPDKQIEYVEPTFHSTVEQAMQKIADLRIRESDATTLTELPYEIKQIRREISDVLSVKV